MSGIMWLIPILAVCALAFAAYKARFVSRAPAGTPRMQEIAAAIAEGADAFLMSEYKILAIFILVLFVLIGLFIGWGTALCFLLGACCSILAGFFGMKVATRANVRTAAAAMESGMNKALSIAFSGGSVMGMCVVGLGLAGLAIALLATFAAFHDPAEIATLTKTIMPIVTGFSMGASSIALFARVGGGIYTKAADVGADLVGKVEAGIPEDDPRNPATIADNVGDNVGDVAGMGADLYESYCGSILSTAALGAAVAANTPGIGLAQSVNYVTAPMVVAGIGTICSIVGMLFVRCKDDNASQKSLLRSLLTGTLGSSVLVLAALAVLAKVGYISWGIFGSVIAGLAAGVIIGQATEYYTSDEYAPTRGIADQAVMGPATTIIDGLATGMYSAGIPVITICIGILCAFGFAGGFSNASQGLYGIGFAAVGMLSTLGITLATDAYGPIADNAGGNAEMSGLPEHVRTRTDALDSLGNTTAATGKGFAIGSAALTALALLASYMEEAKLWIGRFAGEAAGGTHMGLDASVAKEELSVFLKHFDLSVMNPLLLCGLFIGGMMAFVFCAMTMKAVGRAAGHMVEEVRRQFREIPGIMEGKATPDYARCVAISTAGAQQEMIVPSLLAVIVPVLAGLILGVEGILGVLAGGLVCGFVLATMLNNAGGAWDNAKKYIEKGAHGGKKLPDGSKNPVHGAAVIGDTVGDPCKDTSGPSLNILIKLMSMVSIVFAPVVLKFSPVIQSWLHLK